MAEFIALNERFKERENRRHVAVAVIAASTLSTRDRAVDYEIFLPFPPPPTFLSVDAAERQLLQWVEQCDGEIREAEDAN